MIGIAKTTDQERSDLFRIAASELALEPAIIEKDLWVCYLIGVTIAEGAIPVLHFDACWGIGLGTLRLPTERKT